MICKGTILMEGQPLSSTLFITKEQDKNISYQEMNNRFIKARNEIDAKYNLSFIHEVVDEHATAVRPAFFGSCQIIEVL